jgi:hypothetical protein
VMATVETQARHVDMSADEYHAHSAYGSTALETFRKSRRVFYGVYVARELPPPEPSDAMEFGTLLHWRLLEPVKLTTHVNIVPEKASDGLAWNMRKPAHREDRKAFEAKSKAAKCLCVEQATLDAIEEIAQGVESNKLASKILSQPGEPEFSIFWTDEETGLNLKIRLDWFASLCLDIKTTCDPAPEPYAKQCHKLGYHRKFAHYSAGLRAFCGEKKEFVHLAIGTNKPYTVGQYNLMDRDRNGYSLGQGQRRRTLYSLAECIRTGDWREPYEKGIVDLELPTYAYSEDAYTL